jgi:phosphohistidine phosphatase
MLLLLIRHGIAEHREAFAKTGQDDALRPLTLVGRQQMRQAAQGLRTIARKIDVLASSPFVRARETADVIMDEYDLPDIVVEGALVPDARPSRFLDWLGSREGECIAAVGHEPDLSRLACWFVAGAAEPWIELKKGGVCALQFSGRVRPGEAMLQWVLTPAQLRRLAP